jgi:hypothetical protein
VQVIHRLLVVLTDNRVWVVIVILIRLMGNDISHYYSINSICYRLDLAQNANFYAKLSIMAQ